MEKRTKRILNIAIPATLDSILQYLVGFIDGLFIAKVGLSSVSGVGVANSFLAIYMAVFVSVGIGASSLIARSIGENNLKKARIYSGKAIFLAIILGLIFGILTIICAKPILTIMGSNKQILAQAKIYFQIVGGASIFWVLQNVLAQMLRASEDARNPMIVGFIINILNVLLDIILIFKLKLGVAGAALATVSARIIGVMLLFYFVKRSIIAFSIRDFFDFKNYRNLLTISIPASLQKLLTRVGETTYYSMIVAMGGTIFAAHVIIGNVEAFAYLPGLGLAAATTTLIGISFGAKNKEDLLFIFRKTLLLGVLIISILGLVQFLLAKNFAYLFTKNPAIVKNIVLGLRVDAFVHPILAVNLIVTGALQGIGDTKNPLSSTIIGTWLGRVPLVYLLGSRLSLGIVGVWLAIGIDMFIESIFLLFKFKRQIKLKFANSKL